MDKEKTALVGRELVNLESQFGRAFEALHGYWLANFENCHTDVAAVIHLSDSDYLEALLLCAYERVHGFETLQKFTYLDDDELTPYGLMVTKIRYCLGYLGNLSDGDVVDADQCDALIFAYEAYWKFGDDFILGNVVENLLSRLPEPSRWSWPPDSAFNGLEGPRQFQWLAYTIGKEMKGIARYHRLMQPGMSAFRTAVEPKPAFKDFRAIHAQIAMLAKAERKAR